MTKEEIWQQYGGRKVQHSTLGTGVITLVGVTSWGLVWIEVSFSDRRKVFEAPFSKLQIEAA